MSNRFETLLANRPFLMLDGATVSTAVVAVLSHVALSSDQPAGSGMTSLTV